MATTDFTIQDVLTWARTKPADELYNYWCNRCAMGQFLIETGREADPSVGDTWWIGATGRHEFDRRIDDAARPKRADYASFGQFVKRLESASA